MLCKSLLLDLLLCDYSCNVGETADWIWARVILIVWSIKGLKIDYFGPVVLSICFQKAVVRWLRSSNPLPTPKRGLVNGIQSKFNPSLLLFNLPSLCLWANNVSHSSVRIKASIFFSINHGFEIKRDTQFTPISQIHIAVIGWYSHEGLFSWK